MTDEPATPFDLPNMAADQLERPDVAALAGPDGPAHAPRILVLYGSIRERSYSRLSPRNRAGCCAGSAAR